jgi:hypothetical protein
MGVGMTSKNLLKRESGPAFEGTAFLSQCDDNPGDRVSRFGYLTRNGVGGGHAEAPKKTKFRSNVGEIRWRIATRHCTYPRKCTDTISG